jgi:sortase A
MEKLRRHFSRCLIAALVIIGAWQTGEGLYIFCKAKLAQEMIAHSWIASRASSAPVRPWPWADTYPIARMRVPTHGIDLYVLEGDSGRSLAFGPGHMTRTALPGDVGNAVISAHRDTHFSFLKGLRAGEEVLVESREGAVRAYRVRDLAVVDQSATAITLDTRAPTLTLVTCYPFDALIPRGPLRYVVTAEAVKADAS